MSFQKAHNISNELGEVVVQSAEVTTNGWAGATTLFAITNPVFKTYRILEVGFTVTDDTASTATADAFTIGFTRDSTADNDGVCDGTTGAVLGISLPALGGAAMPAGTRMSTSFTLGSDWGFVAAGAGLVDADGVPRLQPGDQLLVRGIANTSAATQVVFFARLAPEIDREV